ncbi:MAG: hypothetical protein JWO09_2053 [Bacteroidetes bacterium]|nr:hypothetical protein [Bacteroidota bacterium]
MKNLVKISLITSAVLAFASCQKTEFASVAPAYEQTEQTYRLHHTGSGDGTDGEDLFTDKDKCKKCHTTSGRLIINWTAPYMADNRYSSIEELINNFDFVNNVHMPKTIGYKNSHGISEEQKASLITYLKTLQTVK